MLPPCTAGFCSHTTVKRDFFQKYANFMKKSVAFFQFLLTSFQNSDIMMTARLKRMYSHSIRAFAVYDFARRYVVL